MGKSKRGLRKKDATGRSAPSLYMTLDYDFVQSPAWRALSGPAVKVWMELRSRYHKYNNGKLSLGLSEAASLLGMGKTTAHRALKELEINGFLVMTKRGQWYGRFATEWRMTTLPCEGHQPTNDWRNWRPEKARSADTDPKIEPRYSDGTLHKANGSASIP